MQANNSGLGAALVGGLIGAAVGVGLHVVLETGMLGTRVEASWFAVVIGLLTGLGVRVANRHHMGRSYARGAVSALIALAAIVASSFAIKEVMSRKEMQAKTIAGAAKPAAEAPVDNGADAAEAAPAEAPPAVEPAEARAAGGIVAGAPRARPSDLNPWQFVFMALGGLVAYELGRGVDHSKRVDRVEGEPAAPLAAGTDPSV